MAGKAKILVVDNDYDFVEVNRAVLENAGYEISVAYSHKEGLERIRVIFPDLIVLDLMMEKHDSGFQFARDVKSDPAFKETPILMLTSVREVTGVEFSQELDGYWMRTDDFLEKPVSPERLLGKVEELLARREKGTEN
ncbi:MAG: response regulator [Candidatus Eisenbacteria sp.]|nr:response regulator [Candidatus Eisenbacteria bacterium]